MEGLALQLECENWVKSRMIQGFCSEQQEGHPIIEMLNSGGNVWDWLGDVGVNISLWVVININLLQVSQMD